LEALFFKVRPTMKLSRKASAAFFSSILLAACGGSSEDSLSTALDSEESTSSLSAAALNMDDLDPSSAYALGAENLYNMHGADVSASADQDADGRAFTLNARAQSSGMLKLNKDSVDYRNIGVPWPTRHEGIPLGVPGGYSWQLQSRLADGNNKPAGYLAYTGWGQAFHEVGRTNLASNQAMELRQFNTLVCTRVNGVSNWRRVQRGGVFGGAFNPDFRSNIATPPQVSRTPTGDMRVFFSVGRAYHFWSNNARVDVPSAQICGFVVTMEARAVTRAGAPLPEGTPSAILIGAGADYWRTRTNPWVNHTTNRLIANGHLRRLTGNWDWYGLSTASTADLNRLRDVGFTE
jgi:hypothetical protein